MQIFILLSAIGLVLSVVVHICVLLGIPNPLNEAAWLLHIGIFVVWFPAVIVSCKWKNNVPAKDFWKHALTGCPGWMKKMTFFFFGYAVINFIIFIGKDISGGVYPASESGTPDNIVKGFSGHWMVFYSAALAIIYSHVYGKEKTRKCPNGHKVFSLTAESCEQCGSKLI